METVDRLPKPYHLDRLGVRGYQARTISGLILVLRPANEKASILMNTKQWFSLHALVYMRGEKWPLHIRLNVIGIY